MRIRIIPLLAIPTIVLLALASSGVADHCASWTTSEPTFRCLVPSDIAGTYYVVEDCCGLAAPVNCMWSFWVYEESNGLPGLQRADEVVDDTCHGQIRGDTIVL